MIYKYKINTNKVLQRLMLKEILRLQKDKTGKVPFKLYKDDVERANSLLVECGYIDRQVHFKDLSR